ncbi:hypothetical protein D3C73_1635770 [compost metagenome]
MRGATSRRSIAGSTATSVAKQWTICGWLRMKATSKRPAAGSLIRALYTPGCSSRRLWSTIRAPRGALPRLR